MGAGHMGLWEDSIKSEDQADAADMGLEGNLPKTVSIGKKPLHRLSKSFSERMFRLKPKELFGPADIQASAGLPLRLGGIP
jgi:hypothetical protein